MIETAKRILTKEKIDRQLSGQCLSTPFMSMTDNHSRRVTFDTREQLKDKIDKLAVVIGKLAARDSRSSRQFKPQIYQSKRGGQNRGNYDRCNYDQQDCENRCRPDSGDRRQYRLNRGIPRYRQNYTGENFRGHARRYQNLKDKVAEENTGITIEMKVLAEIGIETGLEKDNSLETLIIEEMIGV